MTVQHASQVSRDTGASSRLAVAGIRPVQASDRDKVLDLLSATFPRLERDRWGVVFDYGAVDDPPDFGLLAEVDGQVVAFFSILYSDRRVRGKTARFACLNSWCVREDHRGYGLGSRLADAVLEHVEAMGLPALGLTMGPQAMRYFRRRGAQRFRAFHDVLYALSPASLASAHRAPRWVDPATVGPEEVGEEQYRIMSDHMGLQCDVRVLERGGSYCILITRRRTLTLDRPPVLRSLGGRRVDGAGALLRWAQRILDIVGGVVVCTEVLHASDPEFVRRHRRGVAFRLALTDRTAALCGDPELLGLRAPPAEPATSDYLHRGLPSDFQASDLDVLYSELVYMELAHGG